MKKIVDAFKKDNGVKLRLWVIIGLVIIVIGVVIYKCFFEYPNADAKKFRGEYKQVSKNNVFVYRTEDEILNILDNGTGVIYFGFPECPWCQAYVPILNDMAHEYGIEEIYYLDVYDMRKENTKSYQDIVSKIREYLFLDDNSNPRIYVPDVYVIRDGVIIGHNNDTSVISSGTPKEYYTKENTDALKEKIATLFELGEFDRCTTCN